MCISCFRNRSGSSLWLSYLLLFFCLYPLVANANDIVDQMGSDAPCFDTDGDGYGWNGSANCPPFLGTVGGQVARLVSNAGDLEKFGSNVFIDGERMLIGDSGRNVFLLRRDVGNQWFLDATLSIDDPANNGSSNIYTFALQGDTKILADELAYSDVPLAGTSISVPRRTGAVYVFNENNNWTKLTPSDLRGLDRFGDTVALAGDFLLVGAPDKERDDAWRGPGVPPEPWVEGAVYVFHRNAQGQWIEEAIIERDDDYGNFGRSVSLDANGVAVIGSGYDISPYVFKRVAPGDWREVSRLDTIEAMHGPVRSFALDAETLLVGTGAMFEGFQVYSYINNGDGSFSGTGQPLSDGSNNLVLSGNTAVVERRPDDLSLDSDIEVFKRSTDGGWQLQNTLKSSLDDRTSFGGRFSVSGNTVVVGAAANFDSLFRRGSVYVFDISQPNDGQRSNDSCIDTDGDGWGWNPILKESCTNINTDAAPCIDTDGDGWGWNGTDSCRIITNDQGCDYTDAHLHKGWGWNAATQQSCAPLVESE